jgi:hypothetical protein
MDFIKLSVAPKEDAVNEIIAALKELYHKDVIDIATAATLQHLFDDLSDQLTVCIEYPYVDKVYRDSYYHYFASKHREYSRDCIRLALFNKTIQPQHFRGKSHQAYLQDAFVGYVVLRPTFPCIIGRTLLHKAALKNPNFVACPSKGNILINGIKLVAEGFPFSSQDTESISCAETSVWAIMEYFGNRYPDYRPTLPSNILSVLNRYSDQRMLPSKGLTVEQISFTLKEFGFGTYIYSREDFKEDFENILATYIESGIPIVATIYNDKVGHAILIIGHENDQSIKTNYKRKLKIGNKYIQYTDYTDIPKKYVIQDDNLTPYKLIDLSNPSEHYAGWNEEFAGCSIESIVVPLYSKIYLEAVTAKQLALKIISDPEYGFAPQNNFIFRFFLTSSRSFKSHLSSQSDLDAGIQDTLIFTKMPKFIWCAEFYKKEEFIQNRVTAIIVLDATEASENEQEALIFAGYPERSIAKVGGKVAILTHNLNLYKKFENNLV